MKNSIFRLLAISLTTIYFALITCGTALAQVPQAIPYQAIARNASGNAIASTAVKVRFSIRDSIATGPVRYQETHTPTTSALGLFSVNVGAGTVVSGSFSGINWAKNAKFLQVELDPAGGSSYTDLGTTQMMSVPYALNAASATSATNWIPTGTSYGEVKLYNCDGLFQYLPCLPKITTIAPSAIGTTSAIGGGNISSNGGSGITASGVCWSTSQNPNIALTTKTNDAAGSGSFSSTITSLNQNTLYYLRAYATNSAGTSYGNQVSFTTATIVLPTISTITVSAITTNSANSGGNISADGGAAITARGICWSTSPNPTIALSTKTSSGTGSGGFSSSITNLNQNTLYYVRAYATNSAGTAYGNQVSFTTVAIVLPTISTTATSAVTTTSANSGGNITADGGATITARGVCWSTSPNPTIALSTKTSNGTGSGSFSSNITSLNQNTLYYFRAYATNSAGTSYGNQLSFTSATVNLPILSSEPPLAIFTNTATSGGTISSDGGGSITARGVCWSITQNPTIALSSKTSNGTGPGSFVSSITGLSPNTLYYVRAYATNSTGTAYGPQMSFRTLSSGNLLDIDGNSYALVGIGTQVWMKENLKVSRYRNGDAIQSNLSDTDWQNSTSGACAVYNDDPVNNTNFGKLYNWHAVHDTRGLCPVGWHIPTDHDWQLLTKFLDSDADTLSCCINTAGSKIKSTGTVQSGTGLWQEPNIDASNISGFSSIPGGYKIGFNSSSYQSLGSFGVMWSNTEISSTQAWSRSFSSATTHLSKDDTYKLSGFSVRCLRD